MPQVGNGSRGAMVNFLRARGVALKLTSIKPADLKPTQAEYSPAKVQAAREHGGKRAILVSSDNHVIDGHHQYRADLEDAPNSPIPVLQIQSPAMHVLGLLLMMPSVTQAEGIRNRTLEDDLDLEMEDDGDDYDDAKDPPWMAGLAEDLQPLGKALESAMQSGDMVAMQAALRKIQERMPEFLAGDALGEVLLGESIKALETEKENRDEE
jgi:hypothetical protein